MIFQEILLMCETLYKRAFFVIVESIVSAFHCTSVQHLSSPQNEPVLLDLFNSALSLDPTLNTKKLANVLINDLIAVLNKAKKDIQDW